MIQSGRKYHTIRPPARRRRYAKGDALSLRVWTGKPYRSKQCEFASAIVEKTCFISIELIADMRLDGKWLTEEEQDRFAYADGFNNAADLRGWFVVHHSLPFHGTVIYFKLAPHET